jgi:hypothetical protein
MLGWIAELATHEVLMGRMELSLDWAFANLLAGNRLLLRLPNREGGYYL